MTGFAEFMAEMYQGVEYADAKHGDWSDRSIIDGICAIESELGEVIDASTANDINGPHGIKAEAVQVAVTAFKLWRRVSL